MRFQNASQIRKASRNAFILAPSQRTVERFIGYDVKSRKNTQLFIYIRDDIRLFLREPLTQIYQNASVYRNIVTNSFVR